MSKSVIIAERQSDMIESPVDIAQAKRPKYNPDKDGPRMKAYMAEVRAKNKAGYQHLTVKQWRKVTAEAGSERQSA